MAACRTSGAAFAGWTLQGWREQLLCHARVFPISIAGPPWTAYSKHGEPFTCPAEYQAIKMSADYARPADKGYNFGGCLVR